MQKKMLALVAAPALLVAACSSGSSSPSGSPSASGFVVTGTVTAPVDQSTNGTNKGDNCISTLPLKQGTPVKIESESGQTLATGSLGAGTLDNEISKLTVLCQFSFTVNNVPSGQSKYQVKVGDQKPSTYTAEQLQQMPTIALT